MMSNRRALACVLAVCAVLAGACRSTPAGNAGSVVPPVAPLSGSAPSSAAAPSSAPATPSAPAAPAASVQGGPVTADGPGWTAAGLDGPVPGVGTCSYRVAADGYALPDPACTPGAVDPAVTRADLASTICRSGGYTRSVRPPESLTGRFKRITEAAYRDPVATSHTELDHLVPLELGGASDTRNLWPEPDQGRPVQFDPQDPFGINAKDGVEDRLHSAVCAGQVGLVPAQMAIASDWTTALARLGVTP